jgi:PIN domain nuclease of toxin-antitoxin system
MSAAPESVLDASALVALLWDEPGASAVEPLLGTSVISALSWAEVLQRFVELGVGTEGKRDDVESLGIEVRDFTPDDAALVARLRAPTRELGLSLADRACLALAMRLGLAAHTADRAWAQLDLEAEIVLIR